MQDANYIESTQTAPEQEREGDIRLATSSRRAAAIEAAYILEAVRK